MRTHIDDLVDYLVDNLHGNPDASRLAELLETVEDERRAVAAGMTVDPDLELDLGPLQAFAAKDGPAGQIAAIALAHFGDAGALPKVAQMIDHADQQLRQTAIAAVGAIGDAGIVARLVAIAENPGEPEAVRQSAVLSLGASGDSRAMPVLQSALKDADKEIRKAAAEAISLLGGASDAAGAVAALCKALLDESHDVRMHAAEALGGLSDRGCVEALAKALHDQHRAVRKHAAIALSHYGDSRATPVLADALADHAEYGREDVIAALERLGGPVAAAALIQALSDTEASLRLAASKALGTIGDSAAAKALRLLAADDPYTSVRNTAAESLAKLDIGSASPAQEPPAPPEPPTRPEPVAAPEKPDDDGVPPSRVSAIPESTRRDSVSGEEAVRRAIEAIGCDFEAVAHGYELIIQLPGNRRRRVQLLLNEQDEEGGDLIRVKCGVGPLEPRRHREALRQNATLTCGAFALEEVRGTDHLVLTSTLPARHAAVAHLRKVIMASAAKAAELSTEPG